MDRSQGSAGSYFDWFRGLSVLRAKSLDLFHDVCSINNLSEHDMLAVQPGGWGGGDEELGAVGVGSGIGHGEEVGFGVLNLEVLICELGAIDGLAARSVSLGEVSALQHEAGDDSVEAGSGISEAGFASAELEEVVSGLGHDVGVEFEGDPSGGGSPDADVEVGIGHIQIFIKRYVVDAIYNPQPSNITKARSNSEILSIGKKQGDFG